MGKFSLKTLALVAAVVLAASCIVFLFDAEAQSVTGRKFTVTFMFKQPNVPEPDTRIYVLVDAANDGDAAIKAYKHLSEKLTTTATERLIFLEAQRKQ